MSGAEAVVVTPGALRDWPLPAPGEGKKARGQVVVVGGAPTTPGAVLLAGEAALRAGAGKLRIVTAEATAATVAVAVPEAGVTGLPVAPGGTIAADQAEMVLDRAESADAVLLGPGFSDSDEAAELLAALVPGLDVPVVVDALGTAYVTEHPTGLHGLDGRAVLTVNPTELARVAGVDDDEVEDDPAGVAGRVAERSRVVVLCGAADKTIVTPDGRCWVVQGGGPGLGVSGSGDTQAGIVAGLLARGAEPAQAAVWGAYLHARAGERLAGALGPLGYLAREVPAQVPRILVELAATLG